METENRDWTGNLSLIAALLVSVVAAGFLISLNRSVHQRIAKQRGASAEVPVAGSMRGWRVRGSGEWTPVGKDQDPRVVLFQLSAPGLPGDFEFWREIALASKENSLDFQFAGLCTKVSMCDPDVAANDGIALLSAMDPIQMNALGKASKEGSALVYRESSMRYKLVIGDGTHAIVTNLLDISKKMDARKLSATKKKVAKAS